MTDKATVSSLRQSPLRQSLLRQRAFFSADSGATNENLFQHPRILLAINNPGNYRRLREHLGEQFEVINPQQIVEDEEQAPKVDLILVDSSSFRQWRDRLTQAKLEEQPTFLPTVLILSPEELERRGRDFWDVADEFITTPIKRLEFSERLMMLLRTRQMAISQQEQLAYLSTHDRATGLPNIHLFKERLRETLDDASLLDKNIQVIALQTSLSRIASTFGQNAQTEAARRCTERFRHALGAGVFLARINELTWGVICPSHFKINDLMERYHNLRTQCREPLDIESEAVHMDIAMGVGIFPTDATDSDNLLDCALKALNTSSDAALRFYSKDTEHQTLRAIRTESRLRKALRHEQLDVWYQPQIRLADNSLSGVEALVRWRLPSGSYAPPDEFLRVAESSGIIVELDRWVLERTCANLQRWRQRSLGIDKVAFNVVSEDVKQYDFCDFIESRLKRYDLAPENLEIEVTESLFFEGNDEQVEKLNYLRSLGLDIAIDDFGTGYSCLQYLQQLPISVLKIDKSFVRGIADNKNDKNLTQTIVKMAQCFDLATIAEGVETLAHVHLLQAMGVDIAQGYIYAKPMPANDFQTWCQHWHGSSR